MSESNVVEPLSEFLVLARSSTVGNEIQKGKGWASPIERVKRKI